MYVLYIYSGVDILKALKTFLVLKSGKAILWTKCTTHLADICQQNVLSKEKNVEVMEDRNSFFNDTVSSYVNKQVKARIWLVCWSRAVCQLWLLNIAGTEFLFENFLFDPRAVIIHYDLCIVQQTCLQSWEDHVIKERTLPFDHSSK